MNIRVRGKVKLEVRSLHAPNLKSTTLCSNNRLDIA